MKLFPDRYKQHINRTHTIVVAFAAFFLLICVTWMIVLMIGGPDTFSKHIRLLFGRVIVIALPLSITAISFVVYSINSRFHNSQSEIYRKKLIESRLTNRADLLKSFKHVRYSYPFRASQTFLPLLIILGLFTILALIYHALFPFGIIAVFSTLMFGPIWFFYRKKKDDYVYLTMEGLSYRSFSKTGLLPWETIKEIKLTKRGYLIQGQERRLIIGVEIEPTSATQPSLLKDLFSNNRHAKELIEQIQQLAPHAYYRQSFLERDIFAKD